MIQQYPILLSFVCCACLSLSPPLPQSCGGDSHPAHGVGVEQTCPVLVLRLLPHRLPWRRCAQQTQKKVCTPITPAPRQTNSPIIGGGNLEISNFVEISWKFGKLLSCKKNKKKVAFVDVQCHRTGQITQKQVYTKYELYSLVRC